MIDQITKNKRLNNFKHVGIAEGISYLVLLLIAMPLKYFADLPEAVKFVGWAHGVLFIAYVLTLLIVHFTLKWSIFKTGIAFLASLVPFGTFIFNKQIEKEAGSVA